MLGLHPLYLSMTSLRLLYRRLGQKLILMGVIAFTLASCATAPMGVSSAQNEIAKQRMRFLMEAACLNETTLRAQRQVLDKQGFADKRPDKGGLSYNDGPSLVFANLDPNRWVVSNLDGLQKRIDGNGCSVGSPAISINDANDIVAQVLAPRLISDTRRLPATLGVGRSSTDGGNGYFFEDFAIVVSQGQITFSDAQGRSSVLPITNITVLRER
ncbi:hypothetical protein [Parasulfitobacter algicola]|uniref:Lipoprotein n=1 Tax=Parasulfitobacter algicola TaxID=2614809 RepID=A0ABX2IST5_9RHOB|nr:hypothetical protein [Sulfitobacter algicola]NSX55061.1 hypothetical protein [Sulfitobacter algicola]